MSKYCVSILFKGRFSSVYFTWEPIEDLTELIKMIRLYSVDVKEYPYFPVNISLFPVSFVVMGFGVGGRKINDNASLMEKPENIVDGWQMYRFRMSLSRIRKQHSRVCPFDNRSDTEEQEVRMVNFPEWNPLAYWQY